MPLVHVQQDLDTARFNKLFVDLMTAPPPRQCKVKVLSFASRGCCPMLSRVADSLYWMSRYLERAEHTTRLLDVNLNLMLDESSTSADRRWQRLLQCAGQAQAR
jgi:hypothetical protein